MMEFDLIRNGIKLNLETEFKDYVERRERKRFLFFRYFTSSFSEIVVNFLFDYLVSEKK